MSEGKRVQADVFGASGLGALGAVVLSTCCFAQAFDDGEFPTDAQGFAVATTDADPFLTEAQGAYYDLRHLVVPAEERLSFVGRHLVQLEPLENPGPGPISDLLAFESQAQSRGPGSAVVGILAGAEAEEEVYASVAFNDGQSWRVGSSIGGLDIDVTPRANLTITSEGGGAGYGALVRIGQGLAESKGAPRSGQWFLFAGLDSQALTWRPNTNAFVSDGGVALQEMVLVGDAQAGVAWRLGEANIALAFVHREFSVRGVDFNEQFGGLTITLRR